MATMPNPTGSGVDPFDLLRDYVKSSNQQTAQNQRSEDAYRLQDRALQYKEYENSGARTYERASAKDRARVDSEKYASDMGLDPYHGRGMRAGGNSKPGAYNPDNAKQFLAGLQAGGVNNPYALATIMGNGQQESGFRGDALGDTNLGPGKEAHGTMQWRLDRFQRLQSFAQKAGKDWTDPYTQGQFAAWELHNTHKNTGGNTILNAKSLAEAQTGAQQYLGMDGWDKGSQASGYDNRVAGSNQWFKQLSGVKDASVVGAGGGGAKGIRLASDPRNINRDEQGRRYQVTPLSMANADKLRASENEVLTDGSPAGVPFSSHYVPSPESGTAHDGTPLWRYYPDGDAPKAAKIAGKPGMSKTAPAPALPVVQPPDDTPPPTDVETTGAIQQPMPEDETQDGAPEVDTDVDTTPPPLIEDN